MSQNLWATIMPFGPVTNILLAQKKKIQRLALISGTVIEHYLPTIWYLGLNLLEFSQLTSIISNFETKPSEVFLQTIVNNVENVSESDLSTPEDFFESRIDKIKDTKYTKISKPRNCISKHTAGKAVTEDKTFEKIKTFQSERVK